MMKFWIYGGALAIGLLIGFTVVRAKRQYASPKSGSEISVATREGKIHRIPEPVGVRIDRMIASESSAMNESMPLDKATDVLFAERKSPMRTRAFLKNRIQMMSTAQLFQALMNAEIQTQEELAEVTRRLAKEDPEGAFNCWQEGDLRIYGMPNLYTFIDTLLQTWADADAPAVLARLKKMKRGGSQQDSSLRFSAYWAKIDPAAAARHFSDLVYLRNMQDQGAMVFTDDSYAGQIVVSWKQKDEEGMREFVSSLPPGRERDAFLRATRKSDEADR